MLGLMMDTPLLTTDALRYAATAHGETEIVSRNVDGSIHRYCYSAVAERCLRLSAALLAAGYPHEVLPLTGITHMASQETVAENLLLLQLDFLRRSVARVTHHDEVSITASPRGLE